MRLIKWWTFQIFGCYLCGILTVLPLSQAYQWYRPQWLLLFVLFSQISQPTLFNPIFAWIIGLIADCLLGTQIGEHALIFSIISYLAALLRPKFIIKPLWSHLGKIFLLVCLGQILVLWFHAIVGQNPHTLFYWMGSVTSCIVWPLFVIFLQSFGRALHVTPTSARNL